MLRFARRLSGEHGQSLILFVMCITVMFVIGAIVVDVGLWLSERRGSQTDADFAALAGAYELLNPSGDAVTAASNSLGANNQQGNASFADPVLVDNSCFHRPNHNDAVSVDVKHDSKALFSGIFGIVNPDIGAHAKACVGAAEAPGNVVPFEISADQSPCFISGQPDFTQMCWIAGGAHQSNARGILDLQAPGTYCSDSTGSGDLKNLIENGILGTCLINTTGSCDPAKNGPWYDCVAVQTGDPDNSKITQGTNVRISRDGLCDQNAPNSNHNGIDDFAETVVMVFDTGNPNTSTYAPRDCNPTQDGLQMSPRIVTVIVLATNPGSGNDGAPIKAFAGMYIAGCGDEPPPNPTPTDFPPNYCGTKLVQQLNPAADEGDLYVSAVAPGPALNPCGNGNQPPCTPTPPPTPSPTPTPVPTPTPIPTQDKNCGKPNRPTCTPTPVPTPTPTPSPTPTGPTPTPGGGPCPSGQCAVYGQIVNIILAGSAVGPPTDQTTLFGIALKE